MGTIAGMDIAQLSRLLENLIRFGTVEEVVGHRCVVKSGNLTTQPLKWIHARAGETKTWTAPTRGEQCVILSPSGEIANGVVIVGISSNNNPPPTENQSEHVFDFPDGARISYNHDSGALDAIGIKTANIQASVSVTFDTPETFCTGKLTVADLLTYSNGIAGTGGGNGNTITGDFNHTDGRLTSNGVTVHDHYHDNVQPGSGNSGGPH